jgi:hypothetical protein
MSEALWHQGQQEVAIRHAVIAEKLAPGNTKSHFLLWRLYAETGRASLAEEELKLFKKCTQK